MNHLLLLFCLAPLLAFGAWGVSKKSVPKSVPWTSIMDTASWQLTKAYSAGEKWRVVDSCLEGTDTWIGHRLMLGDFVLEGEFLYNGKSEGGIVLRGDRNSWFPWLSGYKMDIDADMPGTGHITFPFRPQPNPGMAQFRVGEWQRFSVRAKGPSIAVLLNAQEVIRFNDDHYRYGQLCLEGDKNGVRYRNLRMQSLDKEPPKSPRSPYAELFDGATLANWVAGGSVAVVNGTMEINGNKNRSEARFSGQPFKNGIVELDVWCKRAEKTRASYRIGLRSEKERAGTCFTCRNDCILSCGTGQCFSPFPMFQETQWTELWRFELDGQKVEAYRFGEKVMTCTDSTAAPGTITVAADSCILLVRGALYRSFVQITSKKKR